MYSSWLAVGCTRLIVNLRAERHTETCWKPRTDNGVKKWLAKVTGSTIIACSNPSKTSVILVQYLLMTEFVDNKYVLYTWKLCNILNKNEAWLTCVHIPQARTSMPEQSMDHLVDWNSQVPVSLLQVFHQNAALTRIQVHLMKIVDLPQLWTTHFFLTSHRKILL